MEDKNHEHDEVQPLIDDVMAKQEPAPVKADVVNIQGNAANVEAREVTVTNGGIGSLKGGTLDVKIQNGGIGALSASTADVHLEAGGVGALVAREATVHGANVGMVAALKLGGDVKVAFDVRAGLIAGAVIGLVLAVSNALLRRGRK